MLRFLRLLILLPIAVLLLLFAVANRQLVTLVLDPFSSGAESLRVSVPLFVFFFATLTIGVIAGSTVSWFAQGRHRRAERHFKRECSRLESENAQLKTDKAPAGSALAIRG